MINYSKKKTYLVFRAIKGENPQYSDFNQNKTFSYYKLKIKIIHNYKLQHTTNFWCVSVDFGVIWQFNK